MISHRGNANTSLGAVMTMAPHSFAAGAIALALVSTYVGCGGSTATPEKNNGAGDSGAAVVDSGTVMEPIEASPVTPVDAAPEASLGAPSSIYPAFKVDVPQVVNMGNGSVLAAPVIVTVTWSNDPDAASYNALGDAIGSSSYWSDVTSEYGVGKATSGTANHVSITAPPPAAGFDDVDLDAYVEANAGVGGWPAPTPNTIYALYLPPGSLLYQGGPPDAGGQDMCAAGAGGYHTESQNKNLVYAIVPHCQYFPGTMTPYTKADVEFAASHELEEASTDPHVATNPAFIGFDNDHLAMSFFNQSADELGDACENFPLPWITDSTDLPPFTFQRQWSNKSAAAGSQWCVPNAPQPFCNTTFLPSTNLDTISVDLSQFGAGKVQSKGFKVPLNTSRTFPIGMFSDMATSGPFTVDVPDFSGPITQDQNGNNINNGTATVKLDKTSGVNGEIINVTVTPTSYSSLGVIFLVIRSVPPTGQVHGELPILISQN